MFSRVSQVFRRYADRHVRVSLPGFPLLDDTGAMVGYLEEITWQNERLHLSGWTVASRVVLIQPGSRAEVWPSLPREDVLAARPDLDMFQPGFRIEAAHIPGRALLGIEIGTDRYLTPLPPIMPRAVQRQRRRQALPFAGALLGALPDLVRWYLGAHLDSAPEVRARLKRRFGLAEELARTGMGSALFPRPDDPPAPMPEGLAETPVTIVLPVYNAFDLLQEALARLVAHTDLPWHLVLVEDASPDDRVRPWLRDWAAARNAEVRHAGAADRVSLLENDANLGFIRSVNRAFAVAIARGHHVVLLNSDALVPAGWAGRLIRPLLLHDGVASVTPMSNDAEIFTAPVICHREVLAPGEADAIDALAQQFQPDADLAVAPTGVGFCMAMHIDVLRALPEFDTTFGRGYGEEVDWCQKARARGLRHLGLPGLFVEHRGGESFGSAEKRKLVAANNAVIARRYRDYDREVQEFIRQDPLATPRLALGIAFAARRAGDRPVPVYVAHSLGGGAEHYLMRRIADDLDRAAGGPGAALVLRVGSGHRWLLELHTPGGMTRGVTADFDFVRRLLAPLGARRIVYSNAVGDSDPVTLPDLMLALRGSAADAVEVLFHDFFPLSPRYTLLDAKGVFRGVPVPGQGDTAHRTRRPDGSQVDLAAWRAAWGRLIDAAAEVVVFSRDSRAHVLAAYPGAGDRLVLRPHMLTAPPGRVVPPAPGGQPVIGVLGNIGQQKGAGVVAALSARLAASREAGLVLIGNIDPAYALSPGTVTHGTYRPEDIADLAQRYRIAAWLIPSVWPETFSFTTHEALATGLPVWCFDLGAQAEAVRHALAGGAPGGVLPLPPETDPLVALDPLLTALNRSTEPA